MTEIFTDRARALVGPSVTSLVDELLPQVNPAKDKTMNYRRPSWRRLRQVPDYTNREAREAMFDRKMQYWLRREYSLDGQPNGGSSIGYVVLNNGQRQAAYGSMWRMQALDEEHRLVVDGDNQTYTSASMSFDLDNNGIQEVAFLVHPGEDGFCRRTQYNLAEQTITVSEGADKLNHTEVSSHRYVPEGDCFVGPATITAEAVLTSMTAYLRCIRPQFVQ